MKAIKQKGKVRQWHVWVLFLAGFVGFISGIYGFCKLLSWVFTS